MYRAQPKGSLLAFLIFLGLAPACATAPPPGPGPLTRRASFDLQCAAGELMATKIDERTVGVRGCGKRTVYVQVCERDPRLPIAEECRWLLQGEIQKDGPPPAE